MTKFDPSVHPHRRRNLLTGDWVLVSPHRAARPWQGQVEETPPDTRPAHDPDCYLCPGNRRANGERNPGYADTFVFDNDFPALLDEMVEPVAGMDGLLVSAPERGICRVVCFSPRHDLTLADLDVSTVRRVVETWCEQYAELGGRDGINHVQIFENKGTLMGCSNPHPHGQIWAQGEVPDEPAKETAHMAAHLTARGVSLLQEYLQTELEAQERIVCANDHFVALVPYWAVWPFETMVLCRRPAAAITDLDDAERNGLADILKRITTRYDNLFGSSFPYSAGIHQAPTDGMAHPEWDLHMHFYPPLLRSARVRKFMVGYEMLATPQRDITPEASAERLRACSEMPLKGSGRG